ncbi:Hypothetical predicted protein [Octopus vulgaris]|uniref:C-type lectin domain-containing protein n=1 Tax=Octopus vulgaris TaxID=6645 RepID=A0AA36AHD5_OCTVU|nr:Hypothetical predicted protein [Octopus vulgaris]
MDCFSVWHVIRKANLHVITFPILLFQICLGSNVALREYYGTRVPPPQTAIPEDDKLIQMSNIRSEIECFSHCMTYSKCGMIIYSVSDELCILRKIKLLPDASSFIDIPANSIYTMLQARTLQDEWFHFGLCKDDSKNAYVWQNGEALTFSSWRPGGPDNYQNSQKCADLDPNNNYGWNDIFCDQQNSGIQICEIVVQ